jgi:TonB family protein
MRFLYTVCCLTMMFAAEAGAQNQSAAAADEIYKLGGDVTAPELLPFSETLNPPDQCGTKMDGKVRLMLDVDSAGLPHNVMFLQPLANDLDRFALQIAEADRFKPGMRNGAPVAVAISLEVGIKSCVADTDVGADKKRLSLKLRSWPEQKIGPPQQPELKVQIPHGERSKGSASAPFPLNSVEAQYTLEARKANISGICFVSVTIDPHGMPQNPRITKGIDPGLDQNALIAVNKYRFIPAMKNGKPFSAMIVVEVNFRLY